VTEDLGCRPIIDYINAIDSESPEQVKDMRMVDFSGEGSFSDIHSDISASDSVTPASSIDEDIPEVVHRLSLLESELKELDDEEESYFSNQGIEEHEISVIEYEGINSRSLGQIMEESREEEEPEPNTAHFVHTDAKPISTPQNRGGCDRLCSRGLCIIF
jgi:hypothetical protein